MNRGRGRASRHDLGPRVALGWLGACAIGPTWAQLAPLPVSDVFDLGPRVALGWLGACAIGPTWAQLAPLPVSDVFDLTAGVVFSLAGVSALLMASSLVGLSLWAATRMRPSGAPTVLARWSLSGAGTVLVTIAIILLGAGIEGGLHQPLRDMTGAPSLLGWWVGLRLAAGEAAITAVLAGRLAARTGSAAHLALTWWAWIVAAGTLLLSLLALTALAMILSVILGRLVF